MLYHTLLTNNIHLSHVIEILTSMLVPGSKVIKYSIIQSKLLIFKRKYTDGQTRLTMEVDNLEIKGVKSSIKFPSL